MKPASETKCLQSLGQNNVLLYHLVPAAQTRVAAKSTAALDCSQSNEVLHQIDPLYYRKGQEGQLRGKGAKRMETIRQREEEEMRILGQTIQVAASCEMKGIPRLGVSEATTRRKH
jgi:hypothetical protein